MIGPQSAAEMAAPLNGSTSRERLFIGKHVFVEACVPGAPTVIGIMVCVLCVWGGGEGMTSDVMLNRYIYKSYCYTL